MYGVAQKITQEILVLFQNNHFDADARAKSRASFPPVRRRQCNSVFVFVRQFERADSSVDVHPLYLKALAREASVTAGSRLCDARTQGSDGEFGLKGDQLACRCAAKEEKGLLFWVS